MAESWKLWSSLGFRVGKLIAFRDKLHAAYGKDDHLRVFSAFQFKKLQCV